MKINQEEAEKLIENTTFQIYEGDEEFEGLILLKKYSNNKSVIAGVEHDIIYSIIFPDDGMEEIDVETLGKMGWVIQDGRWTTSV